MFLRPNVTLALNELILSVKIPAGSEILSCTYEYGAIVNILKTKSEEQNLKLRLMDFSMLLKADSSVEDISNYLKSQIKPDTKLVVLSHIFTGCGICLPLKEIQELLSSQGILFIVDGAHAPGAIDLDFQHDLSHLDFYAGNLHKWFMGPKGTAFAWVHPRHQKQIKPLYSSWTYYDDVPEHMKSFAEPGSFACKMLWSHSQSFSAFEALHANFDYWNHNSVKVIQNEILERAIYLQDGLEKCGLTPLKRVQEKLGSPLLCYDLKHFKTSDIEGLMMSCSDPSLRRVQVGLPRIPDLKALRLTAHIHNTEAELKEALLVLSANIQRV